MVVEARGKATGREGDAPRTRERARKGSRMVIARAAGEGVKVESVKKPRLPALDSVRFFLITYISVGHFIACATKNALALAAFSQVNVVV